MGINLGGHHLTTAIQLKIIEDYVLTTEWQTAREMYPKFTKEVEARTNIEPVLGHNFLVNLRKLCNEGRAELSERQEHTRQGVKIFNKTKTFRRKSNG